MDEIWERTVESALDGQTNADLVRTLTLDSMVKCVQGRLPAPPIFEKFKNLQHLSMANIGVSSLEHFPRLRNLQKLNLSDNRITGGLEFLVEAGLESLRDLDLSNNRISEIDALQPLAQLRLVSLDLYECPVTRVKDYRSRVFGLIGSLKYLDKMDAKENERLESDEDEEDEDEEEDPESGEVDGEDQLPRANNLAREGADGVVDVDDEDDSDANENEPELSTRVNGPSSNGNPHPPHSNGFRVEPLDGDEYDDDDEGEEEDDLVDDVDEDVVEIHEINDSDDGEEDGLEEEDDDDDEDDEDEEEVDNEERDFDGPESTGRLLGVEGEIDGHEQGEDDDEDDDGETGEEEFPVEEDGDFEDDEKAEDEEDEYLVQPVRRASANGEEEPEEIEEDGEDEDGEVQEVQPCTSQKRKRSDDDGEESDEDIVQNKKSSK